MAFRHKILFLNFRFDVASARKCCRVECMCAVSHVTYQTNVRRARKKVYRVAFAAIVSKNGIVTVWFGTATNYATKCLTVADTNARQNVMPSVARVQTDCRDRVRAAKSARKHRAPKILVRAETHARKHSNAAITFVRNAVIVAIVVHVLRSSWKDVAAACIPKSCRARNRICAKQNANKLVIAISICAIAR